MRHVVFDKFFAFFKSIPLKSGTKRTGNAKDRTEEDLEKGTRKR
jgi:hypothetical protein